ncbi:hypothetical protein Micbo1qcDRAFT_197849 [Microdochium bolleyi]|uniref:Transcription factor domain-containing protein n=1 Tax=Microdochium bolleyi TaxID=196109 RepID=A0A136IRY6_9PEZI|nr:hypothetical protein Micbo1qcDRAFT_197849 [Microdochium bolleyi]
MEDAFIVSTTLAGIKPAGDSRRLIRRHVMKGKNTKTTKARKAPAACLTTMKRPVTTMDLATMGFPANLEPYMLELITRFFVIVEETGSPLFRCTEKGSPNNPYDLIYNDLAHLHIILFMAQTYFDSKKVPHQTQSERALWPAHHQRLSHRALLHMNKAIEHLQRKLAAPDLATSLSVIFVVLCLGTTAQSIGDLVLAGKHLRGMHQIIDSRGGIHSLDSYPLVKLKCCRQVRFDISMSLKTGSQPILNTQISWKAQLADPGSLLGLRSDRHSPCNGNRSSETPLHMFTDVKSPPDARLVNVWSDLSGICRSFNLALQTGCKVDTLLSTNILVSIMYRLQCLEGAYQREDRPSPAHLASFSKTEARSSSSSPSLPFQAHRKHSDSSRRPHFQATLRGDKKQPQREQHHELARLAMLAFATMIFFEPHGIETEYTVLSQQFSSSILDAYNNEPTSVTSSDAETLGFHLWIVYIACTSLFSNPTDDKNAALTRWLHERQLHLRRFLGLKTWVHTRQVLKSFLWVDAVNDNPGKMFYDTKISEVASGQGIFVAGPGVSRLMHTDLALGTRVGQLSTTQERGDSCGEP